MAASPCLLNARWSSAAKVELRVSLPVSVPDDNGRRARMPTLRAAASLKTGPPGRLRCDDEQIGPFALQPCEQSLGVAITIHVGRVEERDDTVQRAMERPAQAPKPTTETS